KSIEILRYSQNDLPTDIEQPVIDLLTTLSQLIDTDVIAVIRADSGDQLVNVCRALSTGGVHACEITMTTPGALEAIAQASRELGKSALIGAGSVLDAETARAAILAGARFIFSPVLNLDVIQMAHRYDDVAVAGGWCFAFWTVLSLAVLAMARPYGCVAVPGAMTPTEILTAWSAGADVVKVFPANHFGPQFLRDIHGALPHVKLTPPGGV